MKTSSIKQQRPHGPLVEVAPVDPWQHRSSGMLCQTCMYYCPKIGGRALGRCRRHAPTMSGYPVVFPNDWCGDHKLTEAV